MQIMGDLYSGLLMGAYKKAVRTLRSGVPARVPYAVLLHSRKN